MSEVDAASAAPAPTADRLATDQVTTAAQAASGNGAATHTEVAGMNADQVHSWRRLAQALARHVHEPADAALLSALRAPAHRWPAHAVDRVRALDAAEPGRRLRATGWTPDPQQPDPQTPGTQAAPSTSNPAAPAAAPNPADRADSATAGEAGGPLPGVWVEPDGRVGVRLRLSHPARDRVRAIPGAAWDGTDGFWRFPITRRTALALRAALTGAGVQVSPDAARLLRAAADAPAVPDITVTTTPSSVRSDGSGSPAQTPDTDTDADTDTARLEIRFEHSRARQDDVKRLLAATWDGQAGCWTAPTSRAADALRFAAAHDLLPDAAVTALAAAATSEFDYDHTLDGLRGIAVSDLACVAAKPARGKTKSLADRLHTVGIDTVYDLLMTVPRRYLDRSTVTAIKDLRTRIGEHVGLLARVKTVGRYDRAKRYVRITITDGTGELDLTFFNAPWMSSRFRAGDDVSVYGRADTYTGRSGRSYPQITNPVMDPLGEDTALIVGVYPASDKAKITTWDLHTAAKEALDRIGDISDPLPPELVDRHELLPRTRALRAAHLPERITDTDAARRRLAFDELLRLQLILGMRRAATATETGRAHTAAAQLSTAFLHHLPFDLTGAQRRALADIDADLSAPHPMYRLLQGEVGSGKTLVALWTLLRAVESGSQGVLMAPTEILATQLFTEARDRLAGLTGPDGREVNVVFLANKTTARVRRDILTGLADGSIDLAVGTHALLSEDVRFANLGVVVIDEQHRFGVEQRAALRDKGTRDGTDAGGGAPDLLVMTATPIPRTQALTVFGDLDQTVLDELPPGRTPIATSWLRGDPPLEDPDAEVWALIREQAAQGRQAYVVASLVEDNEKIAAESAQAAYDTLANGALAGLRLGLVHGRQDRTEREHTMAAFAAGDLDVLVATTVIEVGVNVPNATVMVVLNATRFGIAQLHQIRGRVGRGQHPSACILTGEASSADSVRRMQALCESTDGFYLADVDLDLRGEGSLFGARQSGLSDLRVADLRTDRDLVTLCRDEAAALLRHDPTLARRPGLRAEVRAALPDTDAAWLDKS